jgi:apolipoprotein D and lipocalin family protein
MCRIVRVKLLQLALLCLAGICLCSCQSKLQPLAPVQQLDLPRFMGDWYVFAHIPYSLEKGKVGTLDRYALRPDGKIQNSFLFRKGSLDAPLEEWKGVAWVTNKKTNSEWRVQFLWPFSVPYIVTDLDPNYQWAVIGYPSRKLAWVLSRETQIDEKTYAGILERMKGQGYDPALLKQVPQRQ